jgi:DNA-binding response OmpR family regulator
MRILPSTPQDDTVRTAGADRAVRPPLLYVADDDVATLDLLCEIARDAGWDARGFTRISQLRATLGAATPTLLILDDDLPDGRGGDLARELRDDPHMVEVPLLVCTAAHPMRQAEIGLFAPVVSKPFDLSEIEAFLSAAARQGPSASYDQRAG